MSHSPGAPTRLLVAVAHPDDETFGCGGLLLHAAAAGRRWKKGAVARGPDTLLHHHHLLTRVMRG